MRVHNLKTPQEPVTNSTVGAMVAAPTGIASSAIVAAEVVGAMSVGDTAGAPGHQALEIAFPKARIQHLELVVETARSLMGSNHERLLRRLHELPLELVELSNQLRRVGIHATW